MTDLSAGTALNLAYIGGDKSLGNGRPLLQVIVATRLNDEPLNVFTPGRMRYRLTGTSLSCVALERILKAAQKCTANAVDREQIAIGQKRVPVAA